MKDIDKSDSKTDVETNTSKVATTLRKILLAIEELSQDDLNKLENPLFKIEIKFTKQRIKEKLVDEPFEMLPLIETLINFPNRDDALNFLNEAIQTKKLLEKIARHLDIPLIKIDNSESLREKIIESTTGARIRSETIKGPD